VSTATQKRGREANRDVWEKMASLEISQNLALAGPEVSLLLAFSPSRARFLTLPRTLSLARSLSRAFSRSCPLTLLRCRSLSLALLFSGPHVFAQLLSCYFAFANALVRSRFLPRAVSRALSCCFTFSLNRSLAVVDLFPWDMRLFPRRIRLFSWNLGRYS